MDIDLKPEQKKELISKIQYFFKKEFELNLGIIGAEKILDLFKDELSKTIYNKALDDSRVWMREKLESIEIDFEGNYKGK